MANLPADLVEELRERAEWFTAHTSSTVDGLLSRAAEEIEQLRLDLAQQALNGQTVMEQQKEIARLEVTIIDLRRIVREQRAELTADDMPAPIVSDPALPLCDCDEDTGCKEYKETLFRCQIEEAEAAKYSASTRG